MDTFRAGLGTCIAFRAVPDVLMLNHTRIILGDLYQTPGRHVISKIVVHIRHGAYGDTLAALHTGKDPGGSQDLVDLVGKIVHNDFTLTKLSVLNHNVSRVLKRSISFKHRSRSIAVPRTPGSFPIGEDPVPFPVPE